MAYDRNQAGPFWDWVRSMQEQGQVNNHGEGVDHPAYHDYTQGGPFGGFSVPPFPPSFGAGLWGAGPWGEGPPNGPPPHAGWGDRGGFRFGGRGRGGWGGWGGRRGRHGHRGHGSRSPSPNPDQPRDGPEDGAPGAGAPEHCPEDHPHGTNHRGPHGFHHHGPQGREGPHHRGGRQGCRRDGGVPEREGPGAFPFDLSGLMAAFASHPIAQALRTYAEQAQAQAQASRSATAAGEEEDSTFTPPIDIFSTPSAYVLHIALPGAKKEDVGVNWDAEKNELNVAGVVYRAGDEEFLKTLNRKERKVGVFERSIGLPLEGEKEEVDGEGISAKLEDGVLVVIVPKVEKDSWTEIKKVDVE